MQVIHVHRVSKNSNNLRTDSKLRYIVREDWKKGVNGLICSHLCRHLAGILQDLSRAEIDNRLLVAARDNATTEPAAGASVCTCDTAQWRAIYLHYSCSHAEIVDDIGTPPPPTRVRAYTHALTDY